MSAASSTPSIPPVYISFCEMVNVQTVQGLLGATFDQINKGAKHIYYLFSTPGGDVNAGMSAYNVIKGLPIETTMHNVGGVDSIGNAIFLAGRRRLTCQHATFMFHGVGFQTQGNLRFEEKNLLERLDGIKASQGKIGGVIANETSLVGPEIDALFLNAQTKDSNFALQKRIVHNIEPVSIPAGAPLIQLVFQGQRI